MTREQYIKILENKIQRLNQEIDFKIIQGQNYSTESKKHKELLQKIRSHSKTHTFFKKIFDVLLKNYA